jgi:hypothetical protein
MTAQVIFLNTLYWPDQEERARLDNMQEFLTYCHNEYEYSRREVSEEFRKAQKNQVHNEARKRLKIITTD